MFKNYFTTAWRHLIKHKVFSFINISGLALSLTAVWLITLFVADEVSFDRYHKNANRIYRLATHSRWGEEKLDITGTSGLAAAALKNDFPEVQDAVRIHPEGGNIISYEDKKIKDGAIFFADPSLFTVFSYHFLAGDVHALQKPNSVVLTKTLATKLFTQPQWALNKTVSIDNHPAAVAGVIDDVPHNSHFTFNAVRTFPADYKGDWQALEIYTYVLLKKNADINRLRQKMPAFAKKYLSVMGPGMQINLELQPTVVR